MAIDPGRVKALFQSAIERADPVERRAFLDEAVGGDVALRDRLDALIAAHDRPGNVLDRPMAADLDVTAAEPNPAPTASAPPPPTVAGPAADLLGRPVGAGVSPVGSVIAGRYKVIKIIGEGAMGSVYLAEQVRPVERQVALKLIKPGMDSRTVLARFKSEYQNLALMDHPYIAKVLDAGTTDAGQPFFVMELVNGISLTDYCAKDRLRLPERLVLFRQICSAVHHSHQKQIVHRDLKPTNILVERHDGKSVPKVIDFGLAKATSGLLIGEHGLPSASGYLVGTPRYMAPEQARVNVLDVDTRADIYALGVILYELLTGSTPIPQEVGIGETLRMIHEVEPPTPSSRLSDSEFLPKIASDCNIEPARLIRFVRGDLDRIVMMALTKDRLGRYDSAIAFAEDIERFTNHEPVSPGPKTAAYRLKKFARRHRGQVVAVSLVLLALVGGIIGTTAGLIEARKRLRQKDKANEILVSVFRDLNPRGGEDERLPLPDRLGRRLDVATAALEEEATDDPVGVARMQMALGLSQLGLGHFERAIALFTKARATFTSRLGPDDPDTLASMKNLAEGYLAAGKLDRALSLMEETLSRAKAKLGPDHYGVLASMNSLAGGYLAVGKLDRALPLYEETLARTRAKLGPDHPDTLASMNNLAGGYLAVGKLDRALPLLEETLSLRKAKLGPDHPLTLASMNNLASSFWSVGKLDRSIPLFEEALKLRAAKFESDHLETWLIRANLGVNYRDANRLGEALPLLEGAHRASRQHPSLRWVAAGLLDAYVRAGQIDKAVTLASELLAEGRAALPLGSTQLAGLLAQTGKALLDVKAWDKAEPLLRESLAIREKAEPDDWTTFNTRSLLGGALLGQKKYAEAEPLLRSGYEGMKQRADKIPPQGKTRPGEALDRLIVLGEATGKAEEVKAWKEERAKLPAGPPKPGIEKR